MEIDVKYLGIAYLCACAILCWISALGQNTLRISLLFCLLVLTLKVPGSFSRHEDTLNVVPCLVCVTRPNKTTEESDVQEQKKLTLLTDTVWDFFCVFKTFCFCSFHTLAVWCAAVWYSACCLLYQRFFSCKHLWHQTQRSFKLKKLYLSQRSNYRHIEQLVNTHIVQKKECKKYKQQCKWTNIKNNVV